MDLSNPRAMLPKAKSTAGGLVKSLLLLSLAMVLAAAGGYLVLLGLWQVLPDLPVWTGLLAGMAVLVVVLWFMGRRFSWLMPWYYVMPAILFLLTFTFFPVALTFWLAFTDYAGIRNGQLNISSNTAVTVLADDRLQVQDPGVLDCDSLRNGCTDVRVMVYSSETIVTDAVALDGTVLTLADPLPAGRDATQVEMHLPDLGFDFTAAIAESSGTQVILANEPPFPPRFEGLRVQISNELLRRVVSEEGSELVLNEPIPDGFAVSSVARFNDYGYVGWRNFADILGRAQSALLPVFGWNLMFAFLTIILNLIVGVLLAVLLNNPHLRGRNFYRTILILPWALPNIITIQVWKGFLNQNFGSINRLLMLFDVTPEPINWLGNVTAARSAILLVNLWLGLPYMMTAVLSALSAIPRELYEAARIDGASPWQSFTGLTAPLLRAAMIPIVLSSFAFNFNNFNLIFLLTDGGPPTSWGTATARGTDILISWAYNEAFRSQGGYAYGLGSAISILIFIITVAVSLLNFRVTGALKEERK